MLVFQHVMGKRNKPFQNQQEVFDYIKNHQKTPNWIYECRDESYMLRALVDGTDYVNQLIKKIEKIESVDRQIARKKYSKDIVDVVCRVMQPREGVFSASGGSANIKSSGEIREKLLRKLNKFKGQSSIKKYLEDNYFNLSDIDPNGLFFMEYVEDKEIYPTYKSIHDIRNYETDGQIPTRILFEPNKKDVGGKEVMEWRVVDANKEWYVIQRADQLIIDEEKTFEHVFTTVPAVVLSPRVKVGTEKRISNIWEIVSLLQEYGRDKSILTIYKFQNGFPRHWRYEKSCRECKGTGRKGADECPACDGKGIVRINDVTDTTILDMPKDERDQVVAPNIEGFSSPDLDTWTKYVQEMKDSEDSMESTIWGTRRLKDSKNETATGRFIDVQPVLTRLNKYANSVEFIHNRLVNLTEQWIKPKTKEFNYRFNYGRRFIIQSSETIIKEYNEAKNQGSNNTILDKLLEEYLISQYQNNIPMLEEELKKSRVEPYIHNSISEINEIFGPSEANKKVLFQKFWPGANKDQSVEDLTNDFNQFVKDNTTDSPAPTPPL